MLVDYHDLFDYDYFVDKAWFVGDSDLGKLPELAYLGLCITGEAGEIAEKLKKAYRDEGGDVEVYAMVKELGDLLFYIVRCSHVLGFSLEDIAQKNVEKISGRAERGTLRGEGDDR